MMIALYVWIYRFFIRAKEILCNTRGEFTPDEKRFLTLNPVEWTRNNYPIFCRMYEGDPAELDKQKNDNDVRVKINSISLVKLHSDKG